MELKDLVGEHEISGLDEDIQKALDEYEEDSNVFRFVLDGKTYKVVENPSDGYRSYLRSIEISDEKVKHTFPPQKIIGKMKEDEEYSNNDTIQFFDAVTNKIVLEIGTDNYDDYYPCCVMHWQPENLSANN